MVKVEKFVFLLLVISTLSLSVSGTKQTKTERKIKNENKMITANKAGVTEPLKMNPSNQNTLRKTQTVMTCDGKEIKNCLQCLNDESQRCRKCADGFKGDFCEINNCEGKDITYCEVCANDGTQNCLQCAPGFSGTSFCRFVNSCGYMPNCLECINEEE